MTRPEIIRADSIDLQDQNAPSAKDHSRQPTQPAPLGTGPPAPHQAGALRIVAAEAAEESARSPRVSREWTTGELQNGQHYDDEDDDLVNRVTAKLNQQGRQQDNLAVAQNGGSSNGASEDGDLEDGDADVDDDLMDKISSSPSIDDGGYSIPLVWPRRLDSLTQRIVTPSSPQAWHEEASGDEATNCGGTSAEPVLEKGASGALTYHNHHTGEYPGDIHDYQRHFHMQQYTPYLFDRSSHIERVQGQAETRSQEYVENHDQNFEITSSDEQVLAGIHDNFIASLGPDPFIDHHTDNQLPDEDSMMMVDYESSENSVDDYDIPYSVESRFVDSGWGGECLQESEDIDFEFVYALHTFVATVEGQANATKGDTMVLLDDSNSYWWLVRVVKDSSIGYLPAEHIETPTERLARLNKHRNIDLTSAMLGDAAEKSVNPIKKAIRRRNAKNVSFAAPTYVEASDIDYSTDEEDEEAFNGQVQQQDQRVEQHETKRDDAISAAEPADVRVESREAKADPSGPEASRAEGDLNSSETARSSDDLFEGRIESKSRNGTLRNTDSFFKDDTVETKKITLTPNILRDDSSTSTRTSNDSKEIRQRPSLDRLEKDASADKTKDKKDRKEKKDKEKKPGMLSGLFKRKEKKKTIDEEIDEVIASKQSGETTRSKQSGETTRSSPAPSKDSDDIGSIEEIQARASPEIQRHPSKLQKQPRIDTSPSKKIKDPKILDSQQATVVERPSTADATKQQPSLRLVQPDLSRETTPTQQPRATTPETNRGLTPTPTPQKEAKSSTISKILRSASSGSGDSRDAKPIKTTKAKERVELDDFDTTPEDSPDEATPVQQPPSRSLQRPIPGAFPDSYISTPANENTNPIVDRLSESPVHVSPIAPTQTYPPPLMGDSSSQEDAPSPVSSPSPELIDPEDATEKKSGSSTTSTTWSDSHLRTFFDDDGDIKDLLVVVYDKSGVVPAGPDHPVTGNMFREENAKLADITQRLDGMLGDWLARKMRTHGSSR